MIAHSFIEPCWVFGTATAAGLGWGLGAWAVRRLLS